MRRRRTLYLPGLLALVALGLNACARNARPASWETGGDAGLQAYRPAEVDQAPKLIKCAEQSGASQNSVSGGRWEYVTVGFIVTEIGTVDDHSIFVKSVARKPSQPEASPRSIADAQVIALSCEYEPGMMAGQPVRVSVERTFRILAVI